MSRSEYESLLRDDLFADALASLPAVDRVTWRSKVFGAAKHDIHSLRNEMVALGLDCDEVLDDSPRLGQSSFVYRIQTTVSDSDKLVSQLGDLYDLEDRFTLNGAEYALLDGNGRNLL